MKKPELKRKVDVPPRDSQLNFRLDPDMKRRVRICAAVENQSVQEWLTRIVTEKVTDRLKGIGPFESQLTHSGYAACLV
jgi:hypothetical protein